MLVSSQIRPACPCSRKRPVKKQWPFLQGEGNPAILLPDNIFCYICIHLNLSVLITSAVLKQPSSSAAITRSCWEIRRGAPTSFTWPNWRTQSISSVSHRLLQPKLSASHEGSDSFTGWFLMAKGYCPFPALEGGCLLSVSLTGKWTSSTDRLKCLYQPLPVGLSPDPAPHPSTAEASVKQDELSWEFSALLSSPKWCLKKLEEIKGGDSGPSSCQVGDIKAWQTLIHFQFFGINFLNCNHMHKMHLSQQILLKQNHNETTIHCLTKLPFGFRGSPCLQACPEFEDYHPSSY